MWAYFAITQVHDIILKGDSLVKNSIFLQIFRGVSCFGKPIIELHIGWRATAYYVVAHSRVTFVTKKVENLTF